MFVVEAEEQSRTWWPICAECGKAVTKAVRIEDKGCDDPLVCADCLRYALQLLGEYPVNVTGKWENIMTRLFTEIKEATVYQTSDRKTFEVAQDAITHQLRLDFYQWYLECPIEKLSLYNEYDIQELFDWMVENRQTIKQFIELSEEIDETGAE